MELPHQIPRSILDLLGVGNIPAVPFYLDQLLPTVLRLAQRALEIESAKKGLANQYTIGGNTATAYDFLFGKSSAESLLAALKSALERDVGEVFESFCKDLAKGGGAPPSPTGSQPLTACSLESARQWAISWTNYAGVYDRATKIQKVLDGFASTLEDVESANKLFWPTLAAYGLGYNLLILKKLGAAEGPKLEEIIREMFAALGASEMSRLRAEGLLYLIDLRIFSILGPEKVDGFDRFTPGTVTLLQQDPETKDLTPIAVRVAKPDGTGACLYTQASKAWLYALQAAKTSATVYGIWLGHVYHWHIVTAAMQMTMFDAFPENPDPSKCHPIRQLLAPQSDYLIGFDDILLLTWREIAPPTSFSTPLLFLKLINQFATGRSYFEDDPITTLSSLGIREQDFSCASPWDKYPIVRQFLTVWNATEAYVGTFVDSAYSDDSKVAADATLQNWMARAARHDEGNISGLPPVKSKSALRQVLASLVYRITMHGCARLLSASNPGLTFVANFPPCLQNAAVPDPETSLTTAQLLQYLPKTGTIGKMVTFYFTFAFSAPYRSFIPADGAGSNLYFSGPVAGAANQALLDYRLAIMSLLEGYSPASPPSLSQTYQWPLCIET